MSQKVKIESEIRHAQIVEAAIRRFCHFGIQKTTLSEIADDLALSKQALYYYFPDKQTIMAAVSQKLANDYTQALHKISRDAVSVKDALIKLIKVKKSFFEKYFMLVGEAESAESPFKKSAGDWKNRFNEEEIKMLKPIFEKGVATGELQPLDTAKTSALLLDTLYAFRKRVNEKAVPDTHLIHEVFAKQLEVTELFYNGLKTPTWKN